MHGTTVKKKVINRVGHRFWLLVKLTLHDAMSDLFIHEAYETRYVFVLCVCLLAFLFRLGFCLPASEIVGGIVMLIR